MGAMQQANAAAAAAEYNAKVQEQNAQMARDQSSVVAGQKIRESRQRSAGIVAGTGAPRDRVLSLPELDQLIAADHIGHSLSTSPWLDERGAAHRGIDAAAVPASARMLSVHFGATPSVR